MDAYVTLRIFILKQPPLVRPLLYLALSPLLVLGWVLTVLACLFIGAEIRVDIAKDARRQRRRHAR